MSIITPNALIVHSATGTIYYDDNAPMPVIPGLSVELSNRVISGEITLSRARLLAANTQTR